MHDGLPRAPQIHPMTPERFDALRAIAAEPYVAGDLLNEALHEVARLAGDVYVPGAWHCPNCDFMLMCSVIYARSGTIGIDHRKPSPCPNDGTELQPTTWKRDALRMSESMPAAICMARINSLRQEEGSSVTIMSDNADFNGLPNCCIEVIDDWTGWEPKQFREDKLIQALAAAQAAREAWRQSNK